MDMGRKQGEKKKSSLLRLRAALQGKISTVILIFLLVFFATVFQGSSAPVIIEEKMLTNHSKFFRNSAVPGLNLTIDVLYDTYRCLDTCRVEVSILNNYLPLFKGFYELQYLDNHGITSSPEKDNNLTNGIYTNSFLISPKKGETKFNITLKGAGLTFILDPNITSGCTENSTTAILECTGYITGNTLDRTNASIWVHDAVINGTSGNLVRLNTTSGWINISQNVTIDAHSNDAAAGSGCLGTGDTAISSTIVLSANGSIVVANASIKTFGGAGGAGGDCSDSGQGSTIEAGSGGNGGGGSFTIVYGSQANITNVTIDARGGNGGKGGDCSGTGTGGSCASQLTCTSGAGGGRGHGNITINVPSIIRNSNFNATGGTGRDGGVASGVSGPVLCFAGSGGTAGGSKILFHNRTGRFDFYNASFAASSGLYGARGTFGAGCGCGEDSSNPSGDNGFSWFNVSATQVFLWDFTNINTTIGRRTNVDSGGRDQSDFQVTDDVAFFNVTWDSTQGSTNHTLINLTNSTTNRIGFFNNTNFLNITYIYCSGKNITVGNDSALDPQLNFSNCLPYNNGSVSYVNRTDFLTPPVDSNPSITFNIPSTNTSNTSLTFIMANVTISDTNPNKINITLWNATGITKLFSNMSDSDRLFNNYTALNDGRYLLNASGNDTAGNRNETETRNITIDTTSPTISFERPSSNSSNTSSTYIMGNVTLSDDNFQGINITLWNATGITKLFSNYSESSRLFNNYTALNDGRYLLNASGNDTAGNRNETETRNITIDTTAPTINFTDPTTANSSGMSSTNIIANVTLTDDNPRSINITLWNATGIDKLFSNDTEGTSLFNNYINLNDGRYLLNASGNDTAGNRAESDTRNITINTTTSSSSGGGGGGGNGDVLPPPGDGDGGQPGDDDGSFFGCLLTEGCDINDGLLQRVISDLIGGAAPPVIFLQPKPGLTKVTGICGDNICGVGEGPLICKSDCKINFDTLFTCLYDEDLQCNWRENWFAISLLLLLLLAILISLYYSQKNKKKRKGMKDDGKA